MRTSFHLRRFYELEKRLCCFCYFAQGTEARAELFSKSFGCSQAAKCQKRRFIRPLFGGQLLGLGGTLYKPRRFFRNYSGAYCVQVVLIIFSVITRKSAVSRLPVLFCFCASSPASSLPSGWT